MQQTVQRSPRVIRHQDFQSDESGFSDPLSAAARNRSVNWANFVGTQSSHCVLLLIGLICGIESRQTGWKPFAVRVGCYNSSPRETMSNLVKVVAQLRKQREEAQKTVEQLDQALAALGSVDGLRSRGRGSQKVGRAGRTMSAAARKRIAAAQRARWAKFKAAQRKK